MIPRRSPAWPRSSSAYPERDERGRQLRRPLCPHSSAKTSGALVLTGGGSSPTWSLRSAAASTSRAATLGSEVALAILSSAARPGLFVFLSGDVSLQQAVAP